MFMSMANTRAKLKRLRQIKLLTDRNSVLIGGRSGNEKKKDWVEEVSGKKMAAVFHTVMIV